MEQDTPPAPPEAEVIRLARMAVRMTPAQAAEKVRAAGGKISDTYWRDIERGHGGRRGRRVPARASEGVLAQMAHVVGVTPEQLTEAGRQDAATVLTEILRRQRSTVSADLAEVPPGASEVSPDVIAFARAMGVDPDDPADEWLRPVRQEIADAIMEHGAGVSGSQIFHDQPASHIEAQIWDDPRASYRSKELFIAAMRADRAGYETRQQGNGRSGTAGLAPLLTLAGR